MAKINNNCAAYLHRKKKCYEIICFSHFVLFSEEWVTDEETVENSFFDNNPMVMPIGKQDKDVHVPPVAEQKPTGNDNAIPSVPAATSVAEGDGKSEEKKDAGRPSEASVEGKEERVAEPPFPSRLEDAPMGQDAIPRQSTCQKTVATDITKPKQQVLSIWNTTEGDGQ